MPEYFDFIDRKIIPQIQAFAEDIGLDPETFQNQISLFGRDIAAALSGAARQAINGIGGLISFVAFAALTPVVAIYLINDWNAMIRTLDGLVPRQSAAAIRRLFRAINDSVSNLVRGLTLVALIMSVFYSTGFLLTGFEYALLFGIMTGFSVFLPISGRQYRAQSQPFLLLRKAETLFRLRGCSGLRARAEP